MAAEREQREAAKAAAAAAERALEAERRTVAAARAEAAAAAEAAEAERAAKFTADAEARELQRILDAANVQLAQERCASSGCTTRSSPRSLVKAVPVVPRARFARTVRCVCMAS